MLTFGVCVGWSPVTQGGWTWAGAEPPAQQEYPLSHPPSEGGSRMECRAGSMWT